MKPELLRWPDLLVLMLSLVGVLVLGPIFAGKITSPDGYFFAGRKIPGWVLGISLMATIISSMTFLAMPAFTYVENWRYVPALSTYLLVALLAMYLFMPFFRRENIGSAYEYLEKRFGLWARIYAGGGFLLFQIFKAAIVLYAVSLAFETMTGWSVPTLIIVIGVIVGFYSVAGGLGAVVWSDFLQAIIMVVAAAVCLPFIVMKLPGGFSQIISVAAADHKFAVGSFSPTLYEKTFWVMLLNHIFYFSHFMCTDQMAVQRYIAARTDKQARISIFVSAVTIIPVWGYFSFLGTALYVLYKVVPDEAIAGLPAEQVFPYFIVTSLPVGVVGLVMAGIMAAAMSTLSSIINAWAQILTHDFYRRLLVKGHDERHYLIAGRYFSFLAVMLGMAIALLIHWARSSALMDLQQTFMTVLSGGLLGLFLLGFLTKRVDSQSAFIATAITVACISFWLFAKSALGRHLFPKLADILPDDFMINVFSNILTFGLAYLLSLALGKRAHDR